MKNIDWFKSTVEPLLKGYTIEYRHLKEGDFGSLYQIRFESGKSGGAVDFWGLGWVGIFVFDYEAESVILNVLLEPNELSKIDEAFEKLTKIIQGN